MIYLLDTHLLIWIVAGSDRLPASVAEMLLREENGFVFSVVSVWEIAIKSSRRRADFVVDVQKLRRRLIENGYRELPVAGEHAVYVADMPDLHKDPFDRLLVAQAHVEDIVLLTSDRRVAAYGGPVRLV